MITKVPQVIGNFIYKKCPAVMAAALTPLLAGNDRDSPVGAVSASNVVT
jgi:hypothetical protein